jgi:hypothetical protein
MDRRLEPALALRHLHRLHLGGEAGDDHVEPALSPALGDDDRRIQGDDEGEER